MWVRDALAHEAGTLAQLFWRAVREGHSPYDEAARAAWAPECPTAEDFAARLTGLETLVAEQDGLVGFMSLGADGYLDLAFVLPDHRGTGVADRLYSVLEGRARARRQTRLTTHASLMAQPFFARHGWQILAPDPVMRRGVLLDRTVMEKRLN